MHGISVSGLVAWRKGTAGKGAVVPGLSAGSSSLPPLTLTDFFPIRLTSEDQKERSQSGTPCVEGCQSLPQRSHHCREQLIFQAHSALLFKDILI